VGEDHQGKRYKGPVAHRTHIWNTESVPYLELQDCRLFYTLDDHTDAWTLIRCCTRFLRTPKRGARYCIPRRYRVLRVDQRV
jgi:hypothetical protein